MNILVLADSFLPDHTGGITKSLLPEVEGLVKLGHQVTVICKTLHPNKTRYELRNGYKVYRYFNPSKKSIFYRLYPLFSLITLPHLISNLHRERIFDIAYVHNPFQLAGLERVLPDLPCVYVYHASAYSEITIDVARGKYGKLKPISGIVTGWVKSLENKILVTADKIITRSDFMKNDMNKLYKNINNKKVLSLPLCVDTERFYFAENNSLARENLGLPEERPILLTVRRLVARMGIENLITAMQTVVHKFPKVLLLIGGTGYLEKDFQQMIQEYNLEYNVKLLGFIPEELLPTYYQAVNLFVLPTLAYEGFGLVTIEALACGTPVIATPVGASPEILNPLGKEFLFESSTPEAIAKGINSWLSQGFNPNIRKNCMSYCVDNFSKKRICDELEKIFWLFGT